MVQLGRLSFQGPSISMPLCSFLGETPEQISDFQVSPLSGSPHHHFSGLVLGTKLMSLFPLGWFLLLTQSIFELRKKAYSSKTNKTKHLNNVDNSPDLTPVHPPASSTGCVHL